MGKRLGRGFLLPVLMLAASSPLWAQGTAALTGTVADVTGAVVAGAEVRVTSLATGVTRTAMSGSNGVYVFPALAPGAYRVEVTAQGFKTAVRDRVEVAVGLTSTLDITLEVGAMAETVEVTAAAAPINTQDASRGIPFTEQQIRDLPLEARNIVGLLSLQTGAIFVPTGDIRSGSVSGSRSDQANITLDGVDVNDPENQARGYEAVLRATLDSTQEFRTTTTNYGAEQGRSGGAQVQVVTKSGSNELHGSAYWYHRNTATSSNEYFTKFVRDKPPKLNKHIYGGSLGGPVVRNRFFLFGNIERLEESSEDPALRGVPSASFRDGVLIYRCVDAPPNPACPTTSTTVAGLTTNHTVPAGFYGLTPAEFAAIDPLGIGVNLAAIAHFNTYPLPNEPGTDGLNIMGFRFVAPIQNTFNTYIARADFTVDPTGKHTVFWRGNLQDDSINSAPQFPGHPPNNRRLGANRGLALGYNAVLTPSVVNTFRYGYTRVKEIDQGLQTASQISFEGFSDIPPRTATSDRRTPAHHFRNDLALTRGSHTLQTGFDLRFSRIPRGSNAGSFHHVNIDPFWLPGIGQRFMPGRISCTSPGCGSVPAVAPGFFGSWAQASVDLWAITIRGNARYNYDTAGNIFPVGQPVSRRFAADEYEFYIQHSWRLRPTLTVTYGVRYSLYSPPWETNGLQVAPFPGFRDLFERRRDGQERGVPSNAHPRVSFDLSGPANNRAHFYPWDLDNWAPRLSAAWNPRFRSGLLGRLLGDGKSVFRGGYSIVYDRIGLALARSYDTSGVAFGLAAQLGNPFGIVDETTAPRFTGINNLPGAPVIPPAPPGGFPATPPFGIELLTTGMIDDGNRTPLAHTYNLTFERQLPGDFSVEVGYVGRSGRNTLLKREFNQHLGEFRDPTSGMTYWEAQTLIVQMLEEGDPRGFSAEGYDVIAGHRPTANVPPIPFWENLFPGIAGNPLCDIDGVGAAATATQVIYDFNLCFAPSWSDIALLLDFADICVPFGLCSIFGPYAFSLDQWCCLGGISTVGWSEYHGLQLSVRKRYSHGLQLHANYTLAKSLDVASEVERGGGTGAFRAGATTFVQESFNLGKNYSFSDWDLRHQINANWLYELPVGRGKAFGSGLASWLDQVIGGWELTGVFRWTSGFPFNVTACPNCFPTGSFNVARANLAFGMDYPTAKTTKNIASLGGRPSVFPDPQQALAHLRVSHPGEVGFRNVLRGDGYFTIDLALGKSFAMPWEGHRLRFRWETFNFTNTPRFNVGGDIGGAFPGINGTAGTATFGRYNSTYAACDGRAGRCMQFSLRYEF